MSYLAEDENEGHEDRQQDNFPRGCFYGLLFSALLWGLLIFGVRSCIRQAHAEEGMYLTASWYSVADLKTSGQWKLTKGVMANGKQFSDNAFTCASRDYPLGAIVRITNLVNGRFVVVEVTDRINKRFKGKRIDLTKGAFGKIADTRRGLAQVKVEVIERIINKEEGMSYEQSRPNHKS